MTSLFQFSFLPWVEVRGCFFIICFNHILYDFLSCWKDVSETLVTHQISFCCWAMEMQFDSFQFLVVKKSMPWSAAVD
jgi:hypothetical protein